MEVLLGLGIFLTIFFWIRWYHPFISRRSFPLRSRGRIALALVPVFCVCGLLLVLLEWSAKSVDSDLLWTLTYLLLGAGWLGVTQAIFGFLGVSARDDVLERRNSAAAWTVSGQMIAATSCFAGANIGDGPGPEVVIFCALLSTGALFVLWFLVDRAASISETVTIDRHLGTGIRVCGWLTATGIVLGDAVTGDWKSASATLCDFATCSWPAAIFAVLVTLLERRMRSHGADDAWNRAGASVVLACVYVFCAVCYAWKRGIH
jgi:hypothetical protein